VNSLPPPLRQKEAADLHVPVTHGRPLEEADEHGLSANAERAKVGGHVGDPQWIFEIAELLEDLHAFRSLQQLPALVGRKTGHHVVLKLSRAVDGDDDGVAGAGEPAGGRSDLIEDGVNVEGRADAQDRRVQFAMRSRSAAISLLRSSALFISFSLATLGAGRMWRHRHNYHGKITPQTDKGIPISQSSDTVPVLRYVDNTHYNGFRRSSIALDIRVVVRHAWRQEDDRS